MSGYHSIAAQQIMLATHMVDVTTPFAEELPHELYRVFNADPTSAYAMAWRDFVTMIWAPGVTKVATILEAHQVQTIGQIGLIRKPLPPRRS